MLATLLFASNFLFWDRTEYFATTAELQPLLHTWSLAVEEQFYIVFPLIMMLFWGRDRWLSLIGIVALFCLSFLLSVMSLQSDPAAAFFLLPSRGWELLVGALAAIYLRARSVQPSGILPDAGAMLGLAMIAFAVFAFDGDTPFPGASALLPVLGTVLVIFFAGPTGFAGGVLSSKFLVSTGLLSYSLYLWHQPVFALYKHRFGTSSFEKCVPALIALSFTLAFLTLHLVERPFRFRATTKALIGSVMSAATLMIGTGLWIDHRMDANPASVPSYEWALAHAPTELLAYATGKNFFMTCAASEVIEGVEECRFGDPDTPATIALWGDSLALALLYGVDIVAKERGLAGRAFIANGCPPIISLANSAMPTCSGATHERILSQILARPELEDIILVGNFAGAIASGKVTISGEPANLASSLERIREAALEINGAGKSLHLVEQGPEFREPAAQYVLQGLRGNQPEPLELDLESHLHTVAPFRTLASDVTTYVETSDTFCSESVCPAIDEEGDLVVIDRNHVSRKYSIRLAELIFDRIGGGFRTPTPTPIPTTTINRNQPISSPVGSLPAD